MSRTEIAQLQNFNRHPVRAYPRAHPCQGGRRGTPAQESEADRANMPPSLETPTRDAKPGGRTSWVNVCGAPAATGVAIRANISDNQ